MFHKEYIKNSKQKNLKKTNVSSPRSLNVNRKYEKVEEEYKNLI